MKPVFYLAVAHVASHLGKSPLQYSILVNSLLFAKFIHLYNHLTSLRPLLLLLYTPTFLLVDVVTCIAFWVLVHAKGHGWFAVVLASTKAFFCLIMLGSSSTQIAFYLETGGEIKWGAASNFAHDPAGMKLLLSGGLQALMVSIVIVATASVVCQPLYNGSGRLLSTMLRAITGRNSAMTQVEQGFVVDLEDFTAMRRRSDNSALEGMVLGDLDDVEGSRETLLGTDGEDTRTPQYVPRSTRILALAPIITTLILLAIRPRSPPYAHMSGSLPFTLLEALSPSARNMCLGGYNPEFIPFPLPGLISKEFWELPNGTYPGWMPVGNDSMSEDPSRKDVARPTWLPDEKLRGFDRWYEGPPDKMSEVHAYFPGKPNEPTFEGINYDPARDPLRISNLEQSLLESLRKKMGKVTIKHVVILNLESMRKDVFPLKKGSHLHDIIMKNHKPADNANDKLWDITINAETLTGEDSGFSKLGRTDPTPGLGGWRNMSEGMGGINVVGAVTGSTATFKSMLGSHCGVQPLPVDFTVEAHGHIYQPCIPSILKLFNHNKSSSLNQAKEINQINTDELDKKDLSKTTKMTSLPWKSVFIQSITDHFDHQHELNYHMGFAQSIVKSTLRDPSSKYYPPTEKESNYFGYPERQVKPYLRDVFREAEENNQRLFLSHFTSSTHHPWALPVAAGASVDFMKRNFWGSEPHLNKYLNTVKYSDRWMGEVMDMLDEFNIADKTLVVLVGDHGMAFREDAKRHSTFENGHITNMRVPLVFHHPSLPRIQLAVNATAISILPTILDLLITTSSLNKDDTAIASDLIHQYEGQSLIRPYQVEKHGRQAWNIGVLNAGGGFLSVASAAVPFRLILPVCKSGVYRFTSTSSDPNELHPLEAYSIPELASRVRKEHSKEAAEWIVDAEKVGKWWVKEQRRRWRYHGASMQDDRKPSEMRGTGKIRKEHWWNTR